MNTSEYDKSIGMPDIDKEWRLSMLLSLHSLKSQTFYVFIKLACKELNAKRPLERIAVHAVPIGLCGEAEATVGGHCRHYRKNCKKRHKNVPPHNHFPSKCLAISEKKQYFCTNKSHHASRRKTSGPGWDVFLLGNALITQKIKCLFL